MSALATRGLGKSFGERNLFDDVSLSVAPGEALALMGPSGSGKTTFLRCLNGLELADRGSVIAQELELRADASPYERRATLHALRLRVGFVFQDCHLFSHRTVLENVLEGPRFVKHESLAAARPRALAWLERLGVQHRAAAYPRALSGGEQQRAAIARALALEPRVLLLDEPTSALDPARGEQLALLLRGLLDDGLAIITTTHDPAFARALATRTLHLSGGQFIAQNPLESGKER